MGAVLWGPSGRGCCAEQLAVLLGCCQQWVPGGLLHTSEMVVLLFDHEAGLRHEKLSALK